jgi:hypothetical protein
MNCQACPILHSILGLFGRIKGAKQENLKTASLQEAVFLLQPGFIEMVLFSAIPHVPKKPSLNSPGP